MNTAKQLDYPFYQGVYSFRLDTQNRLGIPTRWLADSNATEYFLAWPKEDGSVLVHPAQYQARLMEGVPEGLEADDEALGLLRDFFNHAYRLDPDAQKRVRLDRALVDEMEFKDTLVLAGDGQWFSIWNAGAYKEVYGKKPFLHGTSLQAIYNLKAGAL